MEVDGQKLFTKQPILRTCLIEGQGTSGCTIVAVLSGAHVACTASWLRCVVAGHPTGYAWSVLRSSLAPLQQEMLSLKGVQCMPALVVCERFTVSELLPMTSAEPANTWTNSP